MKRYTKKEILDLKGEDCEMFITAKEVDSLLLELGVVALTAGADKTKVVEIMNK